MSRDMRHPGRGGSYPGSGAFLHRRPLTLREQVELALDLLYRRKWIVIAVSALMLLGAAAVTYPVVPVYQASSYIMVNLAPAGRFTPQSNTDPGVSGDNLFAQSNRSVPEELLLLQISSPLAIRVAERLKEMKVRPLDQKPISLLQGPGGERSVEDLARIVPRLVQFTPEKGSINIIRVQATSQQPAEATLLANVFAEEYETLTAEAGQESTAGTRAFLEEQERQRRAELQQVEAQINSYLVEAGGGGLADSDRQLVSDIAKLEAERDNLRFDKEIMEGELSSLEAEIASVKSRIPQQMVSDTPRQITQLQEKIAERKQHKEQIELRYPVAADRPAVVAEELERTERAITLLEDQLLRSSQSLLNQPASAGGAEGAEVAALGLIQKQAGEKRTELTRVTSRMGLVDQQIRALQQQYERIPVVSARLAQLERSREYAEQAYQYVAQRLLEMRIAGVSESKSGYVRLLQRARWPSEVPNDAHRNLILGGFLGILLGLGLAIVIDKLDNRIFKPDQLLEHGQISLGVVPDMKAVIKKSYQGAPYLEHKGSKVSTGLVTLLEPTSPIAETYRPIRMNLEMGTPGRKIKTIVVTSAAMGDGKSISAANLSITLARAGRRVLLIDADLRRPHLAAIFGLKQRFGLIQLLRGEEEFDVDCCETSIDGLHVMVSGGTDPDASELLGSQRMVRLLAEAEQQFDIVILDTPPVMAVTDAATLASLADGTILVARAGKTKEKELQYTLETLRRVGAVVVGTVLNAFDVSMAYGYKYRYHEYSQYGMYAKYVQPE